MKSLRPIDGKFKSTAEERRKACVQNGHPLIFINCSKSRAGQFEVRQCLCGYREKRFPFEVRSGDATKEKS